MCAWIDHKDHKTLRTKPSKSQSTQYANVYTKLGNAPHISLIKAWWRWRIFFNVISNFKTFLTKRGAEPRMIIFSKTMQISAGKILNGAEKGMSFQDIFNMLCRCKYNVQRLALHHIKLTFTWENMWLCRSESTPLAVLYVRNKLG